MRQWRNGAGNAPRHYAGTRSATGRALSRTRSLTAAAVAVAMMATVAVTSLIPAYNAKADENTLENGSKCTPTSYTLGDASDIAGEDTGVATYVGRDLYVGKNKDNKTSINNEGDVDGSYAVEAEGLTVVNGKLVMRPLKDSWKAPDSSGTYTGAGFRWGTVGFGSQFRPGNGKTVLAIGDTNSGIDTLTSGGVQGTVGAYGKGGFVGQSYAQWNGNKPTGPARGYKYKASIAGGETKWSSNEERSSIVATQGDWKNDANGDVTFNASDPLKSVNGTDYSAYGNYIQQKLSEPLSKIPDTSTDITISVAPEDPIDRYKYNYGDGNSVSYKFIYNNNTTTIVDNNSVKNNEKLITFKGDGVSAMQVFNIKGTDLSSAHYRGVDFKFVDIPDDASVVINVDGSNIDFHTGWRFWWGDTEIGGGFSQKETDNVRKLYSSAAQKIMWNFKNATNVIIRGGVANEDMSGNKLTTDDPAAAMLGSILVPKGSFESHVSTNGRVYVGQDFMMYNPTAIKYESIDAGWEGKTASVLNMDQERHNLPWNGQMIANCPAIQWNKANSAGEALKGTTWKVYGTLEAAEAGTPSLGTITDGEFTDGNDKDGIIKFEGIERNAKYFVKEFATNSTEYTVNPYIYQINTGDDESTHTGIAHVFNAEGNEITGTNADKKLTVSDQIINEKEGAALEWSKVDGTDTNKILSGSEWQLQENGSNKAYQITDSTKAVSAVTIQYDDVAAQSDDSTGSSTTSGADTTVYSCGDALGKCDMNTEPGKFRVVDLADGTYTLTETVAPNGYTAGGSYTVTIANGTATIGNTIAGSKIPNARNTGAISWNKVSSDSANDKKLGGSEWKLTKTKSFGWNTTTGKAEYTDIDIAQQQAITITDCNSESCPAPQGQKIYDVDPVEGQFRLEGLDWGTYTLVETKAPDGYDVDSTVRTFTFGPVSGSDGTGKWNSNGVAPATGAATGNFTTSNVDYDPSVFSFAVGDVKNQPGVILPATGGEGVNKMYAAGLLAVAIAVAGLALSLRRRQS